MTADPAPPPTADPLGQTASAARPSTAGAEPDARRVTAALALLDAVEALYQSGHALQLLSVDSGRVVRLRAMAQTAAKVIPIVKA